jgi:hypothetical protein
MAKDVTHSPIFQLSIAASIFQDLLELQSMLQLMELSEKLDPQPDMGCW